MDFTFDEKAHTYRLDGKRIPSITGIIKPLYDFGQVPTGVLERAALFGTAVHKMVELYCGDDLDIETLDDGLVMPFAAFCRWVNDYKIDCKALVVEKPMPHVKLKYAGTPDLIMDGQAIIEIKSRPINMLTDPLQLIAQEELWKANGGTKGKYDRRVLELRQDGEYTYKKAEHPQAWNRFRYLLDHSNMGEEINKWKTK